MSLCTDCQSSKAPPTSQWISSMSFCPDCQSSKVPPISPICIPFLDSLLCYLKETMNTVKLHLPFQGSPQCHSVVQQTAACERGGPAGSDWS